MSVTRMLPLVGRLGRNRYGAAAPGKHQRGIAANRLVGDVGYLSLLWAAMLIGGGCASVTTTNGDPLLQDQSSSKSAFADIDKLPEQFDKATKKMLGKGANPDKARELYGQAAEQYNQALQQPPDARRKPLLASAPLFQQAAERWPDSALEEDALFYAGESYFFADHYPNANNAYERLLKKYPNSKHLDVVESRRFVIAQYWLAWDDREPQSFWTLNLTDQSRPLRSEFHRAVKIFDRIRIDDPTGKLADDATLAAGNAYFTAGKYLDADNFYTDLRKSFPSSEHQFRAHLLGVKAKLLSYEGPDYSGEPLNGSEELIKQIRRQFPRDADKEREYLVKAYAEVRFRKAERLWNLGRYYDRRAEYRAARFYYNQIVRDYAETKFGELSRQRIGEIANKPDVPPKRLQWLVALFPEQEDVKPLMASGAAPTKKH